MRYVSIDLSSDNHLQQPQIFGGYAGEHNETVLQVKLPERMVGIECSGYRFDFQTSEDNKISSPLIPVSELKRDVISFHLTEQLTIAGKLFFNIVAILSDENTVSLISKTNTVILNIEDSPEGNIVPIDPNGYKDELEKMVDERIKEIDSIVGQATDEGGEIFNDYDTNQAINQYGTAQGTNNISGFCGFKIVDWNNYENIENPDPEATTQRYIRVRDNHLPKGKKASDIYEIGDYVCIDGNLHVYDELIIANIVEGADETDYTELVIEGKFYRPNASGGYTELTPYTTEDGAWDMVSEEVNWICVRDKLDKGVPSAYCMAALSAGINNVARGKGSLATGADNFAYGDYSLVTGRDNNTGFAAFASGRQARALGEYSVAAGYDVRASHDKSAVFNYRNYSSRNNQLVAGEWAATDEEALFIVGNGTGTEINRSNAFVVKEDGTAQIKSQGINEKSLTQYGYVKNSARSYEPTMASLLSTNAYNISEEDITNLSVVDIVPFADGKYTTPNSAYYALNSTTSEEIITECRTAYNDYIKPKMAICFNHEVNYETAIDPTTYVTTSADKATKMGTIQLFNNKFIRRYTTHASGQRTHLIASMSPVDSWESDTPIFTKAKNFKTSFIFRFENAQGSTDYTNTMLFGFRQLEPSKFVNGYNKMNTNQCLLAVTKNSIAFGCGENITANEFYIGANTEFATTLPKSLTQQYCLFEIEVIGNKCHVVIHNGSLTTSDIYYDNTFDCDYYADTPNGAGYIGYGIGGFNGAYGEIDLEVLDNVNFDFVGKDYIDTILANKIGNLDELISDEKGSVVAAMNWAMETQAANIEDIYLQLDAHDTQIGEISTALDELHAYAQALVTGGAS